MVELQPARRAAGARERGEVRLGRAPAAAYGLRARHRPAVVQRRAGERPGEGEGARPGRHGREQRDQAGDDQRGQDGRGAGAAGVDGGAHRPVHRLSATSLDQTSTVMYTRWAQARPGPRRSAQVCAAFPRRSAALGLVGHRAVGDLHLHEAVERAPRVGGVGRARAQLADAAAPCSARRAVRAGPPAARRPPPRAAAPARSCRPACRRCRWTRRTPGSARRRATRRGTARSAGRWVPRRQSRWQTARRRERRSRVGRMIRVKPEAASGRPVRPKAVALALSTVGTPA